jgi:hypothetical protein
MVTEFLFAPYFGACIHVPPPPPNQLLYVQMAKGIPITELQDVIYVIGIITTDSFDIDQIGIGYKMAGEKIEKYDGG